MPARGRTISANLLRSSEVLRHIVRGVRADGLDAHAILGDAWGSDASPAEASSWRRWLRDPDGAGPPLARTHVRATVVWTVWERVLQASRDGLGVAWRYGAHVSPDASRQTFRMLTTTSASIAVALEMFARYSSLLAQAYTFSVVDVEGDCVLRVDGVPARLGASADVVFLASAMARWGKRMLGRDLGRAFRLGIPLDAAHPGLAAACGADITWNSDAFSIAVADEVAHERTQTTDPALHARLEEHVRQEIVTLRPTTTRRVLDAMANTPGPQWRAEVIARLCALSARTMRRELRAEGASFQELLDRARRAEAMAWAARETDSELAVRLGFADARAFRRAFQRWTGHAPAHHRRSR